MIWRGCGSETMDDLKIAGTVGIKFSHSGVSGRSNPF
jgi:hypothetical protein